MRAIVVLAGLLGAVGVVGFASARIPPAATGVQLEVADEQLSLAAPQPGVRAPVLTQEARRLKKRKARAKGPTGAKLALPKACEGGRPNWAAKPYC